MIKADKYIKDTISKILAVGHEDENPRPKWEDGSPAHSRFITGVYNSYNIALGEFPITTLRNTALKGAFHDIESIYIKQTNILSAMDPSIHSWWKDFVVGTTEVKPFGEVDSTHLPNIGATYGHTVERYNLMNILLSGMEKDPFSRRHMLSLWQNQQMVEDPKALTPCAFLTMWSIFKRYEGSYGVDLTLIQRSQDFCTTASINPAQYVMLGMMVCNHLTHVTGKLHSLENFNHLVQNCHIYLRHIPAAMELLEKNPLTEQPLIKLKCNPKNFYEHTIDDFEFIIPKGITKLESK